MKLKKYFRVFGFLFCLSVMDSFGALKVLHLSFHSGCIQDFDVVARDLGLDVTVWYPLQSKESHDRFDNQCPNWNSIYNIGHDRAKRVWDLNKEYFNSFDVVVTSDTAPLARIFLQNEWKKPLVIWICNRFDYCDYGSLDCDFPDQEYYDLFRKASTQKNVTIVGYVAYEHFYAQNKGVNTGSLVIKPCGSLETGFRGGKSAIPVAVKKEETFVIPPREGSEYLMSKCKELGIKAYTGNYSGPYDLKDFKGIIHFPYAWSNLALFENMHLGLVHFVPSAQLLKTWFHSGMRSTYPFFSLNDVNNLHLSEWYCPEHKDLIVYFDSWVDLKKKVESTDYAAMRKKIKAFGEHHKQEMLRRWSGVFDNARKV